MPCFYHAVVFHSMSNAYRYLTLSNGKWVFVASQTLAHKFNTPSEVHTALDTIPPTELQSLRIRWSDIHIQRVKYEVVSTEWLPGRFLKQA